MPSAGVRTLTLLPGDRIEDLARRELGSAALWPRLAAFNRLEYPYLSDDPRDRHGTLVASGTVPAALTTSATAIPLAADPAQAPIAALVGAGDTLLVWQIGTDGVLVADALTVAAYTPATGVVTVTAPASRPYRQGATWSLHPLDQPRTVLGTNDTLLIPVGDPVTVRPADRLVDLLGTDIAIDETGALAFAVATQAAGAVTFTAAPPPLSPVTIPAGVQVRATDGGLYSVVLPVVLPTGTGTSVTVTATVRSPLYGPQGATDAHTVTALVAASAPSAVVAAVTAVDNPRALAADDGTGDLATAGGIANLRQAVVHRLMTRQGALPYFPAYGNAAWESIGMRNRHVEQALVEAAIIGCIQADDRVAGVKGGAYLKVADTINIAVDVAAKGTDERFVLRDIQLAQLSAQN